VLGSVPIKRGLKRETAAELDQDLVGALDHMVVGDDIAVLGDHEARAQRLAAAGAAFGVSAVEKIIEEILKRRAFGHHRAGALPSGDHGRGRDVDDRIADLIDQIGKGGGRGGLRARRGAGHDRRQHDHGGDQRGGGAAV
jgi:hypothetical protein